MSIVSDPPSLSPTQFAELLPLLVGADSVELKLTVPESARRSAVASLGMDALQAQIRQVAFLDTPDLALNQAGVVVRARRVQGKVGDAVVKLRPIVPEDVPKSVRALPDFGVEVDAMPGGFVCSGTMKTKAEDAAVKRVLDRKDGITKLLTLRTAGVLRRARAGRIIGSTTWPYSVPSPC